MRDDPGGLLDQAVRVSDEFIDGGLLAQISVPDMRGPIGYALSYPERLDNTVARLDLDTVGKLTFHKPDADNFPCLGFAYEALKEGGTMPAVLNAANEAVVSAFLERRIPFTDIPVIINKVMRSHIKGDAVQLEAVIEADRWARERAARHVAELTA